MPRSPTAGQRRATRAGAWIRSTLLAAPLVLLSAWVVVGGIRASHGPVLSAAPGQASAVAPAIAQASAVAPAARSDEPWLRSGLPEPADDLPAARLEERVDGAADYLRAHGCRRLIVWRIETPPADLELLVFGDAAGASAVLGRDAGPSREPGPGDEASVADQSILFRRGVFYARLLADPGAGPGARGGLIEVARRLDGALAGTLSMPSMPSTPGGPGGAAP